MVRGVRAHDGDPAEDEEDGAPAGFPPPARSRSRSMARARPSSPRPWDTDEALVEEPEPWEEQDRWARGKGTRRKPPVYWRARDSLWFEPLVALAVIVLLLVTFWAYTSNWPPAYVVESDSMQHGPKDVVGIINAGDIVLAQKTSVGAVVPYVVGLQTHYQTYGESGDVLLYYPDGDRAATPIIHRAIVYLEWDPLNSTYNATDLNGLPCGAQPGAVYSTPGTRLSCGTSGLGAGEFLNLFHLGFKDLTIQVNFAAAALGYHSGFITLGDNNTNFDQNGTSTPVRSALVESGWVIGVARGMIPWFGAVKLLLDGDASLVPSGSWSFLGLSIAGVIFVALTIHFVLRREGVESELRRQTRGDDDEPGEEEPEERPARPARGFLGALTPWRSEEDDAPADGDRSRPAPARSARSGRTTGRTRDRPAHSVRHRRGRRRDGGG